MYAAPYAILTVPLLPQRGDQLRKQYNTEFNYCRMTKARLMF